MPLYLVLRHPRGRQTEKNIWCSDFRRVDSVMTSNDVATLCNIAQIGNEYVYVHRAAWGSDAPEITSRARVASVTRVGKDYRVMFSSPEPWAKAPPVKPFRGQEYYFDVPPRAR